MKLASLNSDETGLINVEDDAVRYLRQALENAPAPSDFNITISHLVLHENEQKIYCDKQASNEEYQKRNLSQKFLKRMLPWQLSLMVLSKK